MRKLFHGYSDVVLRRRATVCVRHDDVRHSVCATIEATASALSTEQSSKVLASELDTPQVAFCRKLVARPLQDNEVQRKS
eukprot:2532056-Amphidinium_carterae.1